MKDTPLDPAKYKFLPVINVLKESIIHVTVAAKGYRNMSIVDILAPCVVCTSLPLGTAFCTEGPLR
jgi:hypothetical protein